MSKKEYIISRFKELNIELSDKQAEQFLLYYEMLVEWNEKINLTAITEFEEVVEKHFIDSVSIVKTNILCKPLNLIDIGTGAGFPGIPIKIVFNDIEVTLLDSLQKRVNFLNLVIENLGLIGICALHGRAEDYAKLSDFREFFDICVSRAVANLSSLSELCIPFVKVGGYFISYKSEKTNIEIADASNAIDILGCHLDKVLEFNINNNTRTLLLIKKNVNTDIKYPRKAGIPIKKPLK